MGNILEVVVPDIGDFQQVPVVELLVQPGDRLSPETPVVTLESDKASMEVPAEVSGVVVELLVAEGDRVSAGSLLLRYSSDEGAGEESQSAVTATVAARKEKVAAQVSPVEVAALATPSVAAPAQRLAGPAAPSVRRLAREFGVDLARVQGSGPKGRLKKEDLHGYVKGQLQKVRTEKAHIPEPPPVDFSRFGPVERVALGRIRKISGAQLARNWATIPHVTSFEEADITELDGFRRQLASEQPVKLTLLPFLMKAVQHCLLRYPTLNSSLQGEELVVKGYFHIGFAVDTPSGLLVPVVRDVDRKGVVELAEEIARLTAKGREGKLTVEEMQGGTFTLSSIGGVGTTHFTPIINSPEVAILGIGRSAMRPVWQEGAFVPRNILPLSLSWDHRAMDGVTAARFASLLCRVLADFRRITL